MKKNITLTNNSNRELHEVLSNNVTAEPVSDGMLFMPFTEETTWLPVYAQIHEDYLLLTIDKPDSEVSLWEKILTDELEEADTWKVEKDRLIALCEKDDQALFKIMAVLDTFRPEPSQLLTIVEELSNIYALERIFSDLLNLTRNEANELFTAKTANILSTYQHICL